MGEGPSPVQLPGTSRATPSQWPQRKGAKNFSFPHLPLFLPPMLFGFKVLGK